MNRYIATVRVKGQLIKTLVFADSQLHARLILQYQFGFDNLTSTPLQVNEVYAAKPKTQQQQRIVSLQQQAKHSQQAVKQERIRQQQQKLNQQRSQLNQP
jgi:HKD family nuclease